MADAERDVKPVIPSKCRRSLARRGAAVTVVILGVVGSMAGCVGPTVVPDSERRSSTQPPTIIAPSSEIGRVTIALIDAYDRGDRAHALLLSCGHLHQSILSLTDDAFLGAYQSVRHRDGDRVVTSMTAQETSTNGISVLGQVAVRRGAVTAHNSAITYGVRWEKSERSWRVCNFGDDLSAG